MPESINVPYDRHTEAHKWSLFAAHALAGLIARGTGYNATEYAMFAAEQANMMLAEFKKRFHFDPQAARPEPPGTSTQAG